MNLRLIERRYAAILAIAGCSLPGGTTVEQTAALVSVRGQFGLEEGDCPYVDTSVERVYLMLGAEWAIRQDPPRLVSRSGATIPAGTDVRLSGFREDGATICGAGVPLLVEDVERANGG